jgi:GNAT superfamily N-acetyltransferase
VSQGQRSLESSAPGRVQFRLEPAAPEDAAYIAALHTSVAEHLTRKHGAGPWSSRTTERGVLYALRISRVFVAREGAEIVGTLRLATKKPWAIDPSYFTKCRRPLYLLGMAVAPAKQRQGIGTHLLEQAKEVARAWPADAVRLDAFDSAAGAGAFYAKCGWTEVGRAVYRNTPLIYFEFLL